MDSPVADSIKISIKHTFPWLFLVFILIHAFFFIVWHSEQRRYKLFWLCSALFIVQNAIAVTFFSSIKIPFIIITNLSIAFFVILLNTPCWLSKLENNYDRLEHEAKGGKLLLVFLAYGIIAFTIFSPTIDNIFRSDYWLIAALFNTSRVLSLNDIKAIATFEMFGDQRSQPLAHLLMFARYKLLGNYIELYNVLNILLHIINGFLIFIILKKITKKLIVPSLFGIFFIVMPGHFDTVAWTYHIYIVLGTTFFLIILFLLLQIFDSRRLFYIYLSTFLLIFLVLFYEAFVLAPAVVLIFYILHVSLKYNAETFPKQQTGLMFYSTFFAYLVFIVTTLIVFNIAGARSNMKLMDLLSFRNVTMALQGSLLDIWETALKNINIGPIIEIKDIVYLHLPSLLISKWKDIFNLAVGIIVLCYFRITRGNMFLVLPLFIMLLSYLFIISLGRVHSNDIDYIVTQPRYQYFPNSLLAIIGGLLLWSENHQRKRKHAMIIMIGLLIIIGGDVRNTFLMERKVAEAMKPMTTHFWRIKKFVADNPDAKIFLKFVPDNKGVFSLGTDIALDILYADTGKITKSLNNATHIYDSKHFLKNEQYHLNNDNLGNFTIEFMYGPITNTLRKEVIILGSDKIFPRVSLTTDKSILIKMRNTKTGLVDEYKFPFSPANSQEWLEHPVLKDWASIIIEKDGDNLCFIGNGILEKKVALNGTHRQWDKDGMDMLGGYYKGTSEVVFIMRSFVQVDDAKYKCSKQDVGNHLNIQFKKPW
ncbi:MAG: hypothetical protein HZB54_06205 [Deltaproteobacteria bacterium]|nr:hypothetical protein [Deltaproteobacteria bacterium]